MYIIVAGCGKIGANLVKSLSNDGHDVVVIDPNEEAFTQLENGTNCLTVTGMPIDEDVLKSAGIEHADALLAVTSDDNVNIMTAQIAKQLYHVPHVVTRVYDPDKEEVIRQMGLCTVCPTIGTLAGLLAGFPLSMAAFESASATGNVGLSIGITTAAMPAFLKIVYIVVMWLARLEFLSVFALISYVVRKAAQVCKRKPYSLSLH